MSGLARLRALLSTWRALLSNTITNYNYAILKGHTCPQVIAFLIGFFVAALVGYFVGRYRRLLQTPDHRVGGLRQRPFRRSFREPPK